MNPQHKAEIIAMTDRELVAFWNVAQFSIVLAAGYPAETVKAIKAELRKRKISFENGKLIKTTAPSNRRKMTKKAFVTAMSADRKASLNQQIMHP